MLRIAIALVAGLLAMAPAEAVTYTFTGLCGDCAGTVTGVLTLADDYVPGDPLTADDFVSFSYGSNLIQAFSVNVIQNISGSFADALTQNAEIDILTHDVYDNRGQGTYELITHSDGNWAIYYAADQRVGGEGGTGNVDFGTLGTWTLGSPDGVPEPGVWTMMTLGFAGIGAGLRLSARRSSPRLAPAR